MCGFFFGRFQRSFRGSRGNVVDLAVGASVIGGAFGKEDRGRGGGVLVCRPGHGEWGGPLEVFFRLLISCRAVIGARAA